MWIDRYHNYVHNLTLLRLPYTYAVKVITHLRFHSSLSSLSARMRAIAFSSQLRNLMPFQFMRCCSISKMYLHNEAQFCAKTNVTSTANQFQFSSSRFWVFHVYFTLLMVASWHSSLLFARCFTRVCIRKTLPSWARKCFSSSIKSNCAITFDRIIFMPYCLRRRLRCQSRRPLNSRRPNRNSWGYWETCSQTSNQSRLPAVSFCVSFDGSETRL